MTLKKSEKLSSFMTDVLMVFVGWILIGMCNDIYNGICSFGLLPPQEVALKVFLIFSVLIGLCMAGYFSCVEGGKTEDNSTNGNGQEEEQTFQMLEKKKNYNVCGGRNGWFWKIVCFIWRFFLYSYACFALTYALSIHLVLDMILEKQFK